MSEQPAASGEAAKGSPEGGGYRVVIVALVINLLIDLLYRVLNPRVQLG